MIQRAMNRIAAALSDARVSFSLMLVCAALEIACSVWPAIMETVITHLSFAAIYLTLALFVAGRRGEEAVHAKLDETVRAIPEADNSLIGIEQQD